MCGSIREVVMNKDVIETVHGDQETVMRLRDVGESQTSQSVSAHAEPRLRFRSPPESI